MIGQVLGHYRLVSQLGAGGMGVVYRARDERLDRDVAVKVLPPTTFTDEATRKRFRREANALSGSIIRTSPRSLISTPRTTSTSW